MEENPAAGIGFCRLNKVNEEDPDKPLCVLERRQNGTNDDFAGDLLICRNILWPPVGAIVRASAFWRLIPGGKYTPERRGRTFRCFFRWRSGIPPVIRRKYWAPT